MALVSCPECNHQVSEKAFKCSSCGFQLRKPKRGFMGKVFKWTFILFNVVMAWWLVAYIMEMGSMTQDITNDAELAGAAIGGTLGTGFLLVIWLLGDIILGLPVLFTRPKSN